MIIRRKIRQHPCQKSALPVLKWRIILYLRGIRCFEISPCLVTYLSRRAYSLVCCLVACLLVALPGDLPAPPRLFSVCSLMAYSSSCLMTSLPRSVCSLCAAWWPTRFLVGWPFFPTLLPSSTCCHLFYTTFGRVCKK